MWITGAFVIGMPESEGEASDISTGADARGRGLENVICSSSVLVVRCLLYVIVLKGISELYKVS